jgi:hypothetical protein
VRPGEGRTGKRLREDGRELWLHRLSLVYGILPDDLAELLTLDQLNAFLALVEIDGPFWGEREAAASRLLCSVVAATAGAEVDPDRFRQEWTLGADAPAGVNLLKSADGVALFAARYGGTLTTEGR